jgi:hypothetical protein
MAGVVAYTSLTFGYLARGAVMARTLRAVHPDWTIIALIVDIRPPGFDDGGLLAEFDQVVYADALGIDRFACWMFKHDVVEACTAVKGRMLCELLDQGAACVIYLDPDIAVFHDLGEVPALLRDASIVLTPHQIAPNDTAMSMADNELGSLQYGIFNLGFLAVANDATGREFAAWWSAQLLRACYDEPERGVFTDQKYCDLVPGLFEGVHVLRDPGYNVASWNLSRRRLAISPQGGITANGAKLRFFHFTKVFGIGDTMLDRYGGQDLAVIELRHWYRRTVSNAAAGADRPPGWAYDHFRDGPPIPRRARRLFRSRVDLMQHFDDPFATGPDSFHGWLLAHEPAALAIA